MASVVAVQGMTKSVQITLTETQRKMVVRSLATTMENVRAHPGESLVDFQFKE
jgi:hypothetical protein